MGLATVGRISPLGDNGDELVDFPNDPDCASPLDLTETNTCGNGLAGAEDAGCTAPPVPAASPAGRVALVLALAAGGIYAARNFRRRSPCRAGWEAGGLCL